MFMCSGSEPVPLVGEIVLLVSGGGGGGAYFGPKLVPELISEHIFAKNLLGKCPTRPP